MPIDKTKLPPGPKSKSPFGQLFEFRKDSIAFLTRIAEEYGDIVQFRVGPIRVVLVNHPDYIKEVMSTQHANFIKGRPLEMTKKLFGEGLLTSEGDFHKRQSRIIQPAFHRKMIESYSHAMTECTLKMMESWEEGMQLDFREEMIKVSMDMAGRNLFDVDIKKEAPEIIEALEKISGLFERITMPFSEYLIKLPLPSNIRFFKARARLNDTIYRMIDNRRKNPVDNGDLLSLLLIAQEEDPDHMTDQQIRDEAITLFLTAFDTTSNALTWTWYLLSQNPEAEALLHEELDRVLQGRKPTVADVEQLKYTRMVLGESMRFYPPSYVIARQAVNDFSIDQYTIPGGSLILTSPYLIHHDTRFHKSPEKYDPATWGQHQAETKSKYEYFPFGAGPRSCIGQNFAWMEGILLLATIAQKWKVKHVPDHPVEFLQLINLRPRYGMLMELESRS